MNYRTILLSNINCNGLGALFYSYGLSSARYIEYSQSMKFLKNEGITNFLDIGCGHSLLPSLLVRQGYAGTILDVNQKSIDWQKGRMRKHRYSVDSNVASALVLAVPR